ncbi:MAG: hypothetical protein DRJ44_00140 [Thermoprotei archaeon]|nr:MAG: hypothetical protein DRJ44_00140 [Thermoprotei archaeon]
MKCEICEEESQIINICKICGRRACPLDFDENKRICLVCSAALCEVCGNFLSIGYCKKCERLICEDCSVKIGAEYICRECMRYSDEKR